MPEKTLFEAVLELADAIDEQGNAASPKLHKLAAECRRLVVAKALSRVDLPDEPLSRVDLPDEPMTEVD